MATRALLRRIPGLRALGLAALLAALLPVATLAQVGVAMDTGKIEVTQALDKGGAYQLPMVGVRNPGGEPSTYRMGVGHIQGQVQRPPPEGWFTFTPREFTLEPGATQPVRIALDVPPDASPDIYAGLIQAQVAPAGEGGQVGAAAATPLTFTVRPSTLLEAWLLRGRGWVAARAPWSYLLPAFVVLAAGGTWLRHRFRLDLRVERRS